MEIERERGGRKAEGVRKRERETLAHTADISAGRAVKWRLRQELALLSWGRGSS
jgi:hypothetical protein